MGKWERHQPGERKRTKKKYEKCIQRDYTILTNQQFIASLNRFKSFNIILFYSQRKRRTFNFLLFENCPCIRLLPLVVLLCTPFSAAVAAAAATAVVILLSRCRWITKVFHTGINKKKKTKKKKKENVDRLNANKIIVLGMDDCLKMWQRRILKMHS